MTDNNTMSQAEITEWLETLSPEAKDRLTNPGVLRVDKTRLKEWIERDDIYITFRGVVIQLTPVASYLVHERASMVQYPEVPLKMNEDKGREEPDSFDIGYLKGMQAADLERSTISINTYLALGTQVIWKPDDVPDVDDDSWSSKLEDPAVLGAYTLTIDPHGTMGRYLQWLKYIAMSDKDYLGLPTQIQILGGGVRQEVLASALSSFPGIQERGADRAVDTKPRRIVKQRNRDRTRK